MDIQDQPLQAQPSAPAVAAQVQPTAPAQDTVTSAMPVQTSATSQAPVGPVSAPAGPPTEPALQLNAIPTEEHQTAFRSHKSLIIGVILAAIVVVSGLSVFIGFNNSSSQYQGFLQKIEAETEKLNAEKASADVLGDGSGANLGSGANFASESDANSGAALPELGEDTLSPVELAPSSPDAEDEGVAR